MTTFILVASVKTQSPIWSCWWEYHSGASKYNVDGTQFSHLHGFATWRPDARDTGQATALTTVALCRY